jgi:nucleotide-binding universal stress UspA family protein
MQPFRTILFAADFSENSREAFRAACSLAVENKTRLFVLHVAERHDSTSAPVDQGTQKSASHGGEPAESRRKALRQKLREIYAPKRPIDVEYRTCEGEAAEQILRTADELGTDLIVMGTHGLTGLHRILAGSVAIAVLRRASCPVLALRCGARPDEGESLRVILHPTDFSEGSAAALRVARSLACDRGARLILQHVAPFPTVGPDGMVERFDVADFSDALEAARETVDGPDLKYPVETWFSRGYAPDEIVRVAREVRCDLIVMGTHARTGLGRLLFGNTAEAVLPEADCPVIVLRSPRESAPTTSISSVEKTIVSVS